MKPKIFIYCVFQQGTGYIGQALAEDGHGLGNHISSGPHFSKMDMSNKYHQQEYIEYYPDGYELIWIEDVVKCSEEFDKAYQLNLEMLEDYGMA